MAFPPSLMVVGVWTEAIRGWDFFSEGGCTSKGYLWGSELILLLQFAQRRLLKYHCHFLQIPRNCKCLYFELQKNLSELTNLCLALESIKSWQYQARVLSILRRFLEKIIRVVDNQMVENPAWSRLDPSGSFLHGASLCVQLIFFCALEWVASGEPAFA